MRAAGQTLGGTYRDFASSNDLAAWASTRAASNMKAGTMAGPTRSPENKFHVLVERNVSQSHRADPALRAGFSAVIQDHLDHP
jgi:hypothetical protein